MAIEKRKKGHSRYSKIHKRTESKKAHLKKTQKRNEIEYKRVDQALSSLNGYIEDENNENYESTQIQVEKSERRIKSNNSTLKECNTQKKKRNKYYVFRDKYGDMETYFIDYNNLSQVRRILDIFKNKLEMIKIKYDKFIANHGGEYKNYDDNLLAFRQSIEKRIAFYEKIINVMTDSILFHTNLTHEEFIETTNSMITSDQEKEDEYFLNYNFTSEEKNDQNEGETTYSDDEMDDALLTYKFDDNEDEDESEWEF